jgi:phosphonate degradation associated HDIG domain protein
MTGKFDGFAIVAGTGARRREKLNAGEIVAQLLTMVHDQGQTAYGRESVSHYEHAMQTALLAEQAGASSALITASLLHDLGYMLHAEGEAPAERGIDTHHERIAEKHLRRWFGDNVTQPIGMHVLAKRYLCAIDPDYHASLSLASASSLLLQGGPMTATEAEAFLATPYAQDAVSLRRWDDEAKVPELPLPPIDHFRRHVEASLAK